MTHRDDPQHDPDDDALIERLLAEGLRSDAESDDPRLRRVRELAARLDELGALEGDAARVPATDPGMAALEQRAESLARARLTARVPPANERGFRTWGVAIAAVLLLGASLWWAVAATGGITEVDRGEPFKLNSDRPGQLSSRSLPNGSMEFAWAASTRRGTAYEVAVYDRDPAVDGVLLARSRILDDARWDPTTDHTPTEVRVSEWPTIVWIEVRADSPSGGVVDLVSEPFSR